MLLVCILHILLPNLGISPHLGYFRPTLSAKIAPTYLVWKTPKCGKFASNKAAFVIETLANDINFLNI